MTARKGLESALRGIVRNFRKELDLGTLPWRLEIFNNNGAMDESALSEAGAIAKQKTDNIEAAVQAFIEEGGDDLGLSEEAVRAYAARYVEAYEGYYLAATNVELNNTGRYDSEQLNPLAYVTGFSYTNGTSVPETSPLRKNPLPPIWYGEYRYINWSSVAWQELDSSDYYTHIEEYHTKLEDKVAYEGAMVSPIEKGELAVRDVAFLLGLQQDLIDLKDICQDRESDSLAVTQKKQKIIGRITHPDNQELLTCEQTYYEEQIQKLNQKLKQKGLKTSEKKALKAQLKNAKEEKNDIDLLMALPQKLEAAKTQKKILKELFPPVKKGKRSLSAEIATRRVYESLNKSTELEQKLYEADKILGKVEDGDMSAPYEHNHAVDNFDKQPEYIARKDAQHLLSVALDRRGRTIITQEHVRSSLFPADYSNTEGRQAYREVFKSSTDLQLQTQFDPEAEAQDICIIKMYEEALIEVGCAFKAHGLNILLEGYDLQPANPIAEMVSKIHQFSNGTSGDYIRRLKAFSHSLNQTLAYTIAETNTPLLSPFIPPIKCRVQTQPLDKGRFDRLVDAKLESIVHTLTSVPEIFTDEEIAKLGATLSERERDRLRHPKSKTFLLPPEQVQQELTACANSLKRHLAIWCDSQEAIEINPELLAAFSGFDLVANSEQYADQIEMFREALAKQHEYEQQTAITLVQSVFAERQLDGDHMDAVINLVQMALNYGPELVDAKRMFDALYALQNPTTGMNSFYGAFASAMSPKAFHSLAERITLNNQWPAVPAHLEAIAKIGHYSMSHNFDPKSTITIYNQLAACETVGVEHWDNCLVEAEKTFLAQINNTAFIDNVASSVTSAAQATTKRNTKKVAIDTMVKGIAKKIKIIAVASQQLQTGDDMQNASALVDLLESFGKLQKVTNKKGLEAGIKEINEVLSAKFAGDVEHAQVAPDKATGLNLKNTQVQTSR